MTATAFSKEFINDFIDYTLSFYGDDGMYPMGANRTVVRNATILHEIVPDALKDKLGEVDESLQFDLAMCIMDRITLKKG